MKNQPGILLYRLEYSNIRNILTQEQKGNLLDALMDYSDTGEEYQGNDPAVKVAFSFFATMIRRSVQAYRHRCDVNRENMQKHWAKRKKEADSAGESGNRTELFQSSCTPEDTNGYDCIREESDVDDPVESIYNTNTNTNQTKLN